MRIATIRTLDESQSEVGVLVTDWGVVTLTDLNEQVGGAWSTSLFDLIQSGQLEELNEWYKTEGRERIHALTTTAPDVFHKPDEIQYAPLYRNPRKIWGIGLNYVEHAVDLSEKAPNTEPASFMKPDTTIIGPGDTIVIPRQSERTTAEAELGIIIGKRCKHVSEAEAPHYVAGYTTILDMTAEDILQKNPRYLTRAKSFDTFFSFGPQLVTPDEVDDILALEVATVHNGEVHRKNVVANMTFRPWYLIAFHSQVMPLLPGDILSTGTPGAAAIQEGDIVECHIGGFEKLVNLVKAEVK